MIKAVLFDMDGVLIEAKDWHYEALNDALLPFCDPIARDEHLAIYDGLPTKNKLEMLHKTRGLPRGLHSLINDVKQHYTMELIWERCRPMFHHQFALAELKRRGMKIAVCSNSIRSTVVTMMERAALTEYLDLMVSNQDVKKAKPDPEMYLTAMEKLGFAPAECMIVEDNEHGIQAARASGGHLLEVATVYDVNIGNLLAAVDRAERGLAA
jgi:HAD superfamily hydrolase (TIGR01509 family)